MSDQRSFAVRALVSKYMSPADDGFKEECARVTRLFEMWKEAPAPKLESPKTLLFRHIKTGNIYVVVRHDILNCTNAQDGQEMVLYANPANPAKIFVREKSEFEQKFEPFLLKKH